MKTVYHELQHGGQSILCCQCEEELCKALHSCRVVIGPTPFAPDHTHLNGTPIPIWALTDLLTPRMHLLCGALPRDIREELVQKGIPYTDLMTDEGVAIKNAVATAEGLIAEIIRDTPYNLQGSRIAIIGYGRCGRCLAGKLRALGCEVTAVLRPGSPSASFAWADGILVCLLEELPKRACDILINTVPAVTVDLPLLLQTHPLELYDIASLPGGFSEECKEVWKEHYHFLPGLPGRCSPKTSGEILAHKIQELLPYILSL